MKRRPHERSTQMFAGLAESFGVSVDSFDKDKWSAAITAAKALDNLVDDDHIYDSGQYSERLAKGESIPYLTDEEAGFVHSVYSELSDKSQGKWHRSASQLGVFALKRLQAEDIYEYISVVREESPLMASVLEVESDDLRADRQQREEFNTWLVDAVRTMFVLDTCSDFIKDHNEGNVSVPITPRSVGVLARCAVVEAVQLSRSTPLSTYPVMFKRVVTKTIEKAGAPGFWSNQFVWKGE